MPGLLDGKSPSSREPRTVSAGVMPWNWPSKEPAVVVNDLGTTVSGDGSGRDANVVVDIIQVNAVGRAIADYGDVGDEDQVEALVDRA